MNGKLKPFQLGSLGLTTFENFKAGLNTLSVSDDTLRKEFERISKDIIYINDEYQVNINKDVMAWGGEAKVWHLSIKRKDKEPIHDWRDLQAIKNMLCGEEYEGIELYPAQSRVMDTANQFHIWVIMEVNGVEGIPTIPIGWTNGSVQDENESINGSKQRKL